jgi:hypothetical protein
MTLMSRKPAGRLSAPRAMRSRRGFLQCPRGKAVFRVPPRLKSKSSSPCGLARWLEGCTLPENHPLRVGQIPVSSSRLSPNKSAASFPFRRRDTATERAQEEGKHVQVINDLALEEKT